MRNTVIIGGTWLGALAVAALATACHRGPDLDTRTLEHGGITRTYHLLPLADADTERRPLVVALHGGGGRGDLLDRGTDGQISREAARRGWRIVFPEGVAKGWHDGRPAVSERDERRAGVDDVGFLAALIDHLVATESIDPARIYMMGISNGGFMTQRFALDGGGRIAAGAAVTAQVAEIWRDKKPRADVSMLWMNGTEDPLVPYAGGQVTVFGQARGAILSTDASVDWWARDLGCAAPTSEALPDRDPKDETRVHRSARACRGGLELVLYRVEGGGHTWPDGDQYLPRGMIGRVSRDLDGTAAIFDFFARHRR